MKNRTSSARARAGALALTFTAMLISTLAAAQDQERRYLLVAEVKVKGSHIAEFIDLQRQYAAARKAAGLPSMSAWQVIRGRTNTFHFVSSTNSYAVYDEPFQSGMDDQDWGRWVTRIQRTIESRTLFNLHAHDQLTISAADDAERNLLSLRIVTVEAGQNRAYNDWVAEKLAPALRDAGVTGVSWAHVTYGASPFTWYAARRVENWAELDRPGPFADLSDRQYRALMEDGDDITVRHERLLLRYREDLSN